MRAESRSGRRRNRWRRRSISTIPIFSKSRFSRAAEYAADDIRSRFARSLRHRLSHTNQSAATASRDVGIRARRRRRFADAAALAAKRSLLTARFGSNLSDGLRGAADLAMEILASALGPDALPERGGYENAARAQGILTRRLGRYPQPFLGIVQKMNAPPYEVAITPGSPRMDRLPLA
jgi:hypothetical protein